MVERTDAEPLPDRVNPQTDAGMAALAAMNEREFEIRLAGLKKGRERIKRIHRELLEEGTDYGLIPGTPKPCLLKPGAEKLIQFYGFAVDFEEEVSYANAEQLNCPPITIISKCRLHLGDLSGPVVATGRGAANSWERRYRAQSDRNGPYDLLNTLVKMASKRSMVDAALRATGTSSLFSQDLEEGNVRPQTAPAQGQRRDSDQARASVAGRQPAAASGSGARPVAAASAPGGAPAGPLVAEQSDDPIYCDEPDCGVSLSIPEIRASQKHFGGESHFCQTHGRIALERKRQLEAAHAEMDAQMDAASTELAQPSAS